MSSCIIIAITIIIILIFGCLLLFIRNKSKITKLRGGLGNITDYGSTIKLYQTKYNPYVCDCVGNIVYNENHPIKIDENLIMHMQNIAKNPLAALISINTNNTFYRMFSSNHPEIKNNLITDQRPLNLENILLSILSYYIDNQDLDNILFEKQVKLDKLLSNDVRIYKIKHIIAQGNTGYVYNGKGNYIMPDKNFELPQHSNLSFRFWYNKNDPRFYMNICPENNSYIVDNNPETIEEIINNEKLNQQTRIWPDKFYTVENNKYVISLPEESTKLTNLNAYYGKIGKSVEKGKLKQFGIADIYPSSMNIQMAFLIYYLGKQQNMPDDEIDKLIALHILEIYLVNIYGSFAHYKPYNSSISNAFYVN